MSSGISPDSKLAANQAQRISLDIEILLQSLEQDQDVDQKALKVARYHLMIGCVQLYKSIKGRPNEFC